MELLDGVDFDLIEDGAGLGDGAVSARLEGIGPVAPAGADALEVEAQDGFHAVAEDAEGGDAGLEAKLEPEVARPAQERDLRRGEPTVFVEQVHGLAVLVEGARIGGQDLVAGGKGGHDLAQPVTEHAKRQQVGSQHEAGRGLGHAVVGTTHEDEALHAALAAELFDVVAAHEGAQAVGHEGDGRLDRPLFNGLGQLLRREAHVLAPIVGKLEQVLAAFVAEVFHQVVAQAAVLLHLDEVGDDDDLIQDAARLEGHAAVGAQDLGVGEEVFDVGPDALAALPELGAHETGNEDHRPAQLAGDDGQGRIGHGELGGGEGGLEEELHTADLKAIAGLEGVVVHALAAQPDAVGAAQVLENELIAAALDNGMATRDALEVEREVVAFVAADGQRVAVQGQFPGLMRGLNDQARPAGVVERHRQGHLVEGGLELGRGVDHGHFGLEAGGAALKAELASAEGDDVAGGEGGGGDAFAIEADAVTGAEVDEGAAVGAAVEAGVVARDAGIGQDDVVGHGPAKGDAGLAEGKLLLLAAGEGEDQLAVGRRHGRIIPWEEAEGGSDPRRTRRRKLRVKAEKG